MAYLKAYCYADASGFGTSNAISVDIGVGATPVNTTSPLAFSAFLSALATALNAATGIAWTVTYSATTRKVTTHCAAPHTHTLTLPGNSHTFLGFSSTSYGALQDHTAEGAPAGRAELLAVECEAP